MHVNDILTAMRQRMFTPELTNSLLAAYWKELEEEEEEDEIEFQRSHRILEEKLTPSRNWSAPKFFTTRKCKRCFRMPAPEINSTSAPPSWKSSWKRNGGSTSPPFTAVGMTGCMRSCAMAFTWGIATACTS